MLYQDRLAEADRKWEIKVIHLKSQISALAAKKDRLERKLRQNVRLQEKWDQLLTPQQLNKLEKGRVRWTPEDIVKALTVRSISVKAYETAAAVWKYALPGTSTLRKFTKKFTCAPAILSDVVNVLAQHCKTLPPLSRLCIMLFDEMSVDSRYTYDLTFDSVVSHSKAQVATQFAFNLISNIIMN
jgi:hypothetical protein